ncbi:MAG: ABC transporter permease, partial [Candidatus Sulfotelmatobacter sp.]
MHRDLLGQAFAAMRHDLRKTTLTMAGMAWGIATVVLLLAYGNGFAQAITNIFQSFGATAVGIFPGRTSEQAGGVLKDNHYLDGIWMDSQGLNHDRLDETIRQT